jgi:hypothetical protein
MDPNTDFQVVFAVFGGVMIGIVVISIARRHNHRYVLLNEPQNL